jgi:transcriptional regulator with XRE-family HTH domain
MLAFSRTRTKSSKSSMAPRLGIYALSVKAQMPHHPGHDFCVPHDINKTVAQNLRRLREAAGGPSQAEIASKAGCDQTSVGRVMRAEMSPTADMLAGLAKAFGVAPWQLLVPDLNPKDLPTQFTESEKRAYAKFREAAFRLATGGGTGRGA